MYMYKKKHIRNVSNTFQTIKFIYCRKSYNFITFKKKDTKKIILIFKKYTIVSSTM